MKKFLLVLSAALQFNSFSQSGVALNFDGINDYVALPNVNTPFNVSASHIKTFQVWFQNTATQGQHVRIFSTGTANWTSGIWFGYAAGSPYLRFELCDGIMYPGLAITGTTSIRGDNQWHQATGVINGNVATLYLDAVFQGSINISGLGTMNAPSLPHIGNSYDNEGLSYFKGNVDELRVWDRVLCKQEIMATMNCELTGSESGLVAYYKFDNGIASGNNAGITNLPDYTSNANNGSLTNLALSGTTSNWVSPGGVVTGSMCGVVSPTICSQQTGVNNLQTSTADVKILSGNDQFDVVSESSFIKEINVFDITGRTILKSKDLHQAIYSIDLTTQSNGLYFIKVVLTNSQSRTFKVIKQ